MARLEFLSQRRVNLPAELSSFVGRRREVAEGRRLLSVARLVTLTGVGGVGKTRLAVRVAAAAAKSFPDGVWMVELSALRDPALLVPAVAATLALPEQTIRPQAEVLADHLADRRALLVLDTCEHLVGACADLVEQLLRTAPRLKILATSRELLHAQGEHALVVNPLSAPRIAGGFDSDHSGQDLAQYEAVRLFVERATAVAPDFALTQDNQRAVAQVCAALDGLPLAIELVAGLLAATPIDRFAEGLQDRFGTLTSRRTAQGRHQALRATIGWSHELCGPAERLLWARLSVFAQDFDLESVEQVCADRELPRQLIARTLAGLVDQSIVSREIDELGTCYRLLDSIREYGAEWLRELGEEQELRRRHRDWYLCRVWAVEAAWSGPQQEFWLRRTNREHANLRAALEYSLGRRGEHRAALSMTASLWFLWAACGHVREGRHWLEQALERDQVAAARVPSPERAKALWVLGWIASLQGDLETAAQRLTECRDQAELYEGIDPDAYRLQWSGQIALFAGDLDGAVGLLSQALDQHGDTAPLNPAVLPATVLLAMTRTLQGDTGSATDLLRGGRALAVAAGEQWMRSHADFGLALAARADGDFAAAARYAREALRIQRHFRDIVAIVGCLELLATSAADRGDGHTGAVLLGHTDRLWRTFGRPHFGSLIFTDSHRHCELDLRALLGEHDYALAFTWGAGLDLGQAIAFALDEHSAYPADRAGAAQPLTRRQHQVAGLVADGLTNRQIAERLGISHHTVDTHLEHILNRLGFTSRAQIAAWATDRTLR
ncbi:MAG: LuxR C-terminal-related transcriptional regulator [Streptosporangiaceae bacterium]